MVGLTGVAPICEPFSGVTAASA